MRKKALLGLGAAVTVAVLAAVLAVTVTHRTPAADAGITSRPAGRSELQPPPNPQQLKPAERVVVTAK